jgi:hypothetical protein
LTEARGEGDLLELAREIRRHSALELQPWKTSTGYELSGRRADALDGHLQVVEFRTVIRHADAATGKRPDHDPAMPIVRDVLNYIEDLGELINSQHTNPQTHELI